MTQTITIITGHTGGLGSKLADALDDNDVLGVSRTKNFNLKCRQIQVDLSDDSLFKNIEGYRPACKFNLVLCAGTLGKAGGIYDADFKDWQNTFNTNVLGNLRVVKTILPEMIRTGYGRIVFIAGGGAGYGYPLFSGYALSKVAIVREVEQIAMEMKDLIPDFSIIALATGAMDTPMLAKVREAGAEVRTVVNIEEPVTFIKNFLAMDKKKAVRLSGKFIHVRDNLSARSKKDKWLLRRIE